MASYGSKGILGAVVAGSLVFCSTAATASAPVSAPAAQVDPWAVLTAMSGGAQAPGGCVLPVVDAAPPPPPPQTVAVAPPPVGINPLVLGLLAIAAGIGIYLAVHNSGRGNSPA